MNKDPETNEKGVASGMITRIEGTVRLVGDEELTLALEWCEVAILISEHDRRRLQRMPGERVELHTLFYIEGNAMGGRMTPRLVGFLSPLEREFFEIFCSVDGVGVKKALRAMVRPVREVARAIEDQDVKMLATFPGIGEATAERIVAKLRRKVGKFALMIVKEAADLGAGGNGEPDSAEPDVIRDAYEALVSVGHGESDARQAIDRALAGKKKFKNAADLIEAIYRLSRVGD